VITPRRITLHRAANLAAFRSTLTGWIGALSLEDARDACVLVPTRAAAEQLRRTVEERTLTQHRRAVVWPVLLTRRDLYDELASRLGSPPTRLSPFEREVLLGAVGRTAVREGLEPPYDLRPGLIAEMLGLYDHIYRLGRTVDDYERNFRAELEKEQDSDRGAARLLQQTVFLAAVYRAYEARLTAAGRCDEHRLRDALITNAAVRPLRRAIVTIADRLVEPDGLWPADFNLLARLPGLQTIDLLCTEAVLAAGYLERLYAAFPDLGELRPAAPPGALPVLVAPDVPVSAHRDPICFTYRDREDELIGVARRLKQQWRQGDAAPLARTALIVRRPLPYLYLARDVFADARVPFETLDTLPLAAEPYAAAVDLVLDAVATDFTRTSLLALLRSPHFQFGEVPDASIAACDVALAQARYLGGLDRLQTLADTWSAQPAPASREDRRRATALPAVQAILRAADALRPLATPGRMVQQITVLLEWLRHYDRPAAIEEPTRSRRLRVRAAVVSALAALGGAFAGHDPGADGDVATLTAAVRRWLGSQTFASHTGEPGLQLVDAQAAPYGDFDDVQIVGLVDDEWPERPRRNVLYPSSLLALLEPALGSADPRQRERLTLQSARAAFRDLLLTAAQRVRLSTFLLENDAVVEPSLLLDDVTSLSLRVERPAVDHARVACSEALALHPPRPEVLPDGAIDWGTMRVTEDARAVQHLRGHAGPWHLPRVSVSRLELFLNCPFKFFAAHVLKLEEEPEDQAVQTPLERGRFLHDLWERFFAEWQRRGHGRIGSDQLAEARGLFAEICEEQLAELSPAEAAMERHKLLGSAMSAGIAHRVFAMEAGRSTRVVERLLEFPLEGEFEFRSKGGVTRRVSLNAKTDRVDVLEGRGLRVIDYKSKNTPDPKVALQLPIYAHLARELLQQARGGEWVLSEAMYLSFAGERPVVSLRPMKGQTLVDVVEDAQDRLIDALDRIADGHFPPQPAKKSLCGPCAYRTVCRLEIRSPEGGEGTEGVEEGGEGREGREGREGQGVSRG
jgi:RecB family exonuclease